MAISKGVNSSKKGMNRDTIPSELTEEEYSFAFNANFHNENGNGKVVLQNEASNLKCSGFKTGYKVVGHRYDLVTELTYFFLTNPTTGFSEIGYISSIHDALTQTPTELNTGGDITVVLETPLEQIPQVGTCVYTTIVTDLCATGSQTGSQCLNFSIDDPFHENNIHIKHGKTGVTLWFFHQRNPPRYVQLDNLTVYTAPVDPCDDVVTDICLDCEKMRIFKLYDIPCLTPSVIKNGGNLRMGMYEFLIAGSDVKGNELSNYYSITNPIPVFDSNNTVLDQTLLDSMTNQAISIEVLGVDDSFEFYKIAVIYRSGLDSAVTVYNQGVYPARQDNVTIHTLKGKPVMDMETIISRRPFYDRAKGAAVANGYLYPYGLTTQRTINLQPVVNLLGAFGRWASYQATEELYENGIGIANYGSTMRDEVYPYSIKFLADGGYESPNFIFVARPPLASEIEVLESLAFPLNAETNSVLAYNPECFGNDRNKRWQFENTATELEDCLIEGYNTGEEEIIREVTSGCYVEEIDGSLTVVDTIASSTLDVESGDDIITYINTHRAEIIASTGPNGADIRDIIEDPTDYAETCDPTFSSTCSEVTTLSSEEIFPIEVRTQSVADVPRALADYSHADPRSSACLIYETDTLGNIESDAAFEGSFMDAGESVLQRLTPTNNSCAAASLVSTLTDPQVDNSNHLLNKGEATTIATLLDARTVGTTRSTIEITLTGNSGTADINVDGVNYSTPYVAPDLTATANNFVSLYAAAILLATGQVVTANAGVILIEGNYDGYLTTTVTNTGGTLAGTYNNIHFTNKLHSNAVWYKVDLDGSDKKIFELGTNFCANPDDNNGNSVRITLYTDCSVGSDVAAYGRIVDDITVISDVNKLVEIDSADFGGTSGTAYIAIDSPIRTRVVTATVMNTLTPPCGCFNVYQRPLETIRRFSYTGLKFGKKQTYTSECSFTVPQLNNCTAVPYKKGLFSYVESTELYPCNKELFDSSELIINTTDIPVDYRTEFENYFVDATVGTLYTLKPDTDLRDKPIRHYKYPDNTVSPFMSYEDETMSQNPGAFNKAVVYPLGFHIDSAMVAAFLDIAVNNGLITEEERSKLNSYEIYRGDRRIQKSVIAKGLLFDMYKYQEGTDDPSGAEDVYYPNYPLNSLGTDQLNNGVSHPFPGSTKNNFFTFHSPDTHHERPTLAKEMVVEGYQFGNAANYFDEVVDHPTYVVLGQASYTLATTIAITEVAFEIFLQSSDWIIAAAAGGVSAPAAAVSAAFAVAGLVVGATFKSGEYRYQWLKTLTDLGKPTNFAYYQACVGYYNLFKKNDVAFQKLRGLTVATYLKSGRPEVTNEFDIVNYNINNLDREYSVALHLGDYHLNYRADYISYDNTDLLPSEASRTRYDGEGKSKRFIDNAASPYAAIKQYSPAQYGSVSSIEWINTGFCGVVGSGTDCDAAFGGDVMISRFSLKRKLPFFRTNAFGLAPLTPFKYSAYFNINPDNSDSRYYLDYEINDDGSNYLSAFIFPSNRSKYILDSDGDDIGGFYVKPPNKFYLFSYGIPYFLVESEINSNFRYAKREAHENFYPNVSDIIEWTQEKNVSIKKPNEFFYNNVYSAGHSYYPAVMLPDNYNRETFDKLNNLSNDLIYSLQDVSESSLMDPWLNFRALDTYSFSKSYGDLISISGIESSQLLARFTNGFTIFGAIDQMRDRLTPETQNIGNGGVFAGRPVNFNVTRLGYAGTQHNAEVSCEFGRFWADAKRGKFFQLEPNAKGLNEISKSEETLNSGLEKWFKQNLPFKILKTYPDINIDNNYYGVGLVMSWDDRFKRVFVTKLDYIPINVNLLYNDGIIYRTDGYEEIIATQALLGNIYVGIVGVNLQFTKSGEITEIPLERADFRDPLYFKDCSWTLAYSPVLKAWISYYGFLPNYYIGYNDYFQTGMNNSFDEDEFGLWSHLPFSGSYQVFYGKLSPFIIEYALPSKLTVSRLIHLNFWLDVRKYYNLNDFADTHGIGFNEAVIYNSFQNTGLLNLVHQNDDDFSQLTYYPNFNVSSIDVLQTEMNGEWSINHMFNTIKNEKSGMPIWNEDCPQILKTLDNRLLDYRPTLKDYLRGDNFLVRLTNSVESRFKFLFRFGKDERDYYE